MKILLTKSTPWCHLVQEVLWKSEHEVAAVTDLGPEYPRQAYGMLEFNPKPINRWGGQDLLKMIHQDEWRGDLIISYLYPRVLTPAELSRAPRAINFHPAPPWHPGFAPYSWAIYQIAKTDPYNGTPKYGVTVHNMVPSVDRGLVLTSREVHMEWDDSVASLQHRTMRIMFGVFMEYLSNNFQAAKPADVGWARSARTKADFEALRQIPTDAWDHEIKARIRACRYPGQPGAYFEGEE